MTSEFDFELYLNAFSIHFSIRAFSIQTFFMELYETLPYRSRSATSSSSRT